MDAVCLIFPLAVLVMEERNIKCSIVMPRYKDKPVSMWTLIPQKLMPPTRLVRYCCAVLKENTGRDRFIATGVRWAESTNRKKNRGTMEFSHRDKEKRIILTSDNDEKRQLFEIRLQWRQSWYRR